MKVRKKPVEVEAVQLRWDNWSEMCKFIGVDQGENQPHGNQDGEAIGLDIPTLEGVMHANENDYIIKGVQGEFYPCKPDIFEATYEIIEA